MIEASEIHNLQKLVCAKVKTIHPEVKVNWRRRIVTSVEEQLSRISFYTPIKTILYVVEQMLHQLKRDPSRRELDFWVYHLKTEVKRYFLQGPVFAAGDSSGDRYRHCPYAVGHNAVRIKESSTKLKC